MFEISAIAAQEILDSRGNPTLSVDVTLQSKASGNFCVPSGASTGEREALELRDKDPKRFNGKGVLHAVSNISDLIAPVLIGRDARQQQEIDNALITLDGTPNKSHLGANAMLGVSMAVAHAGADAQSLELFQYLAPHSTSFRLPVPLMNVINGGAHADNGVDIQEFMIVPAGAPSFAEALRYGAEVFHALKEVLKEKGLSTGVGDEGGFAPQLRDAEEAFELLSKSIGRVGLRLGSDILFALDAAASEFYDASTRTYKLKGRGPLSSDGMLGYWASLAKAFPIVSLEDPLDQNDWDGWKMLTAQIGNRLQLVGDDIFVTNVRYLQRGVEKKTANAILIKLNQIGTLTETLETIRLAQQANFAVVISHRSGETEDVSIADLAVAVGAQQIKTGSLCRSERVAKYNRLLRIENMLGKSGSYWGKAAFKL